MAYVIDERMVIRDPLADTFCHYFFLDDAETVAITFYKAGLPLPLSHVPRGSSSSTALASSSSGLPGSSPFFSGNDNCTLNISKLAPLSSVIPLLADCTAHWKLNAQTAEYVNIPLDKIDEQDSDIDDDDDDDDVDDVRIEGTNLGTDLTTYSDTSSNPFARVSFQHTFSTFFTPDTQVLYAIAMGASITIHGVRFVYQDASFSIWIHNERVGLALKRKYDKKAFATVGDMKRAWLRDTELTMTGSVLAGKAENQNTSSSAHSKRRKLSPSFEIKYKPDILKLTNANLSRYRKEFKMRRYQYDCDDITMNKDDVAYAAELISGEDSEDEAYKASNPMIADSLPLDQFLKILDKQWTRDAVYIVDAHDPFLTPRSVHWTSRIPVELTLAIIQELVDRNDFKSLVRLSHVDRSHHSLLEKTWQAAFLTYCHFLSPAFPIEMRREAFLRWIPNFVESEKISTKTYESIDDVPAKTLIRVFKEDFIFPEDDYANARLGLGRLHFRDFAARNFYDVLTKRSLFKSRHDQRHNCLLRVMDRLIVYTSYAEYTESYLHPMVKYFYNDSNFKYNVSEIVSASQDHQDLDSTVWGPIMYAELSRMDPISTLQARIREQFNYNFLAIPTLRHKCKSHGVSQEDFDSVARDLRFKNLHVMMQLRSSRSSRLPKLYMWHCLRGYQRKMMLEVGIKDNHVNTPMLDNRGSLVVTWATKVSDFMASFEPALLVPPSIEPQAFLKALFDCGLFLLIDISRFLRKRSFDDICQRIRLSLPADLLTVGVLALRTFFGVLSCGFGPVTVTFSNAGSNLIHLISRHEFGIMKRDEWVIWALECARDIRTLGLEEAVPVQVVKIDSLGDAEPPVERPVHPQQSVWYITACERPNYKDYVLFTQPLPQVWTLPTKLDHSLYYEVDMTRFGVRWCLSGDGKFQLLQFSPFPSQEPSPPALCLPSNASIATVLFHVRCLLGFFHDTISLNGIKTYEQDSCAVFSDVWDGSTSACSGSFGLCVSSKILKASWFIPLIGKPIPLDNTPLLCIDRSDCMVTELPRRKISLMFERDTIPDPDPADKIEHFPPTFTDIEMLIRNAKLGIEPFKFVSAEYFLRVLEQCYQHALTYTTLVEVECGTDEVTQSRPPIVLVGDLQGSISDLIHIFTVHGLPGRNGLRYVFTGDITDNQDRRGAAPSIVILIFMLKVAFPDDVVILSGNRDHPSFLHRSGFIAEFVRAFKQDSRRLTARLFLLLSALPLAVLINKSVFASNGAVPRECGDVFSLNTVVSKVFMREKFMDGVNTVLRNAGSWSSSDLKLTEENAGPLLTQEEYEGFLGSELLASFEAIEKERREIASVSSEKIELPDDLKEAAQRLSERKASASATFSALVDDHAVDLPLDYEDSEEQRKMNKTNYLCYPDRTFALMRGNPGISFTVGSYLVGSEGVVLNHRGRSIMMSSCSESGKFGTKPACVVLKIGMGGCGQQITEKEALAEVEVQAEKEADEAFHPKNAVIYAVQHFRAGGKSKLEVESGVPQYEKPGCVLM